MKNKKYSELLKLQKKIADEEEVIEEKLQSYMLKISSKLLKMEQQEKELKKKIGAKFLSDNEKIYCDQCRKHYLRKECKSWMWSSSDLGDTERITSCPKGHQID